MEEAGLLFGREGCWAGVRWHRHSPGAAVKQLLCPAPQQAVCGEAVAAVRAVDILAHQHFFTSPKLAALATQAEILAKVGRSGV